MFADDFGGDGMKKISPEQTRANIVAAYKKHYAEAISGLSAAMQQERQARYGNTVRKPTATEQLADALSNALERSRERKG
jgi:hypothetical protein